MMLSYAGTAFSFDEKNLTMECIKLYYKGMMAKSSGSICSKEAESGFWLHLYKVIRESFPNENISRVKLIETKYPIYLSLI